MTHKELKANGHKFYEYDAFDGSIYLWTEEFWECDGEFYTFTRHSNANRYTGVSGTEYLGNIKDAYNAGFYAAASRAEEACDAYDRMVAEREAKGTPESTFKSARLKLGMTQRQVAEAAGINIRQVQKIESGEIKIANVSFANGLALAKALDVSPYDLI